MKDYLKYKDWYKNTTDKLRLKYGEDLCLVCGLIASTSPQMAVERNLSTAEILYQDYKKDSEKFLRILKNKTRFYKKYGLFKPHYNNIVKTMGHDFKTDLKLNGNKVSNFYRNLIGDYEAVTIDSWMLRYFDHDLSKINHVKKSEYMAYAEKIKEGAKVYGLYPAEYQAVLWIKTRLEHGEEAIGFADFLN
jgi:hypothetical protein